MSGMKRTRETEKIFVTKSAWLLLNQWKTMSSKINSIILTEMKYYFST